MAENRWDSLLDEQLSAIGVMVEPAVRGQLLWLSEELLKWNRKINLTAITVMDEVIEKHIVDSLTAVSLLQGNERLLDVGSGGGFPGVPLKLVCKDLALVSVDAVAKKINFQNHVIRSLGLTHCIALHERIEKVPNWQGFGSGFDLIISRAFASLEDFVSLVLPCLTERGKIVAMKGAEGGREIQQSEKALTDLRVQCVESKKISLPGSGAERTLLIFERIK